MADIGRSMTDVRVSNRAAVMKMLYSSGGLSRKHLSRLLDLTPATITNITADLIKEEIIVEGQTKKGNVRSGRKEVVLDLNLKRFKSLCAYIANRTVCVFCMDLDGELFFEKRLTFDELETGKAILTEVCDVMLAYMKTVPDDEKKYIIGAGFALKGIIDPFHGISIRSFGLWEDNLNVREIVEPLLNMNVLVNNNVRCIANAEMLLHKNIYQHSMLFIKYGPLIGGALIMEGNLYCGQSYQAMELGHNIVEMNGNICRCGKRGCLETVIGFDMMSNNLQLLYSPTRVPILYEITGGDKSKVNMDTILQSYNSYDEVVVAVVNRTIDYLAIEIANAISMINPERIVLYGPPFECKAYMKRLLQTIDRIGVESESAVIAKSLNNLELDQFGCASIVLKEFLDTGAMLH